MGTVENFLGSRLGLRSSRVTSSSTLGDQDECEQLITTSFEREQQNETKKSQGRPWKAKREDYDEDVFGISAKENGNAIPLHRTTGSIQLQDQCVEAEIIPDDTLAKVALRYNVPISELKRVNNLLNEAEFHALKTVKVPAKAHSLLTELLPEASSGTFGRLGGETRSGDGWYVKSVVGEPKNDLYLTDPASSPLTNSAASSEVGVGELIRFQDDVDYESFNRGNYNATNNCKSKEAKKVNKMLKNVDKDLARIKEREASRSISPERGPSLNIGNHANMVSLSLSTPSPTVSSNNTNQFFSSTLGQQSSGIKVINGNKTENPWCSRSGFLCIGSIIMAVIIICLIAYHFDHSKLFLNHSHHLNSSEHAVESETSKTNI